jgi:hypothetical protein
MRLDWRRKARHAIDGATMRRLLVLLLLALSLPAAAADRPVLVELFTSQGCSSCPPADAFLAELAARDDVVALSFHVDYWNYIGWKDPFATKWTTQRQRDYGRALAQRYVYTPEIVVGGAAHAAGSDRAEVERLIAEAHARKGPAVTAERSGGEVRVRVGAGEGAGTVWLFGFDPEHVTRVERGENGGRTLRNVNVVRAMTKLGTWRGAPLELSAEAAPGGCAVVVQEDGPGRVVGAALIR